MRVMIMKKNYKSIPILIALILYLQFPCFTFVSANKISGDNILYKPPEQSREELYQDISFSLLSPYIQKSVEDYYTKFLTDIPTVDPWAIDILSAERPNGYRTFLFVLKIQVKPYVGPHLGVGVDRITITVNGAGDVEVNSFEHIKDYELPPHYQNIIKKNNILNNKSLYFEKAIKQGNFVEITSSNLSSDTTQYHTEIYNIDKLEDFIKNIKDRKPTKIRIVKYASEHGVIWANKLYDLEYNGEKIIDTVYDVYSNPNAFLPSTIYYFDQIIKKDYPNDIWYGICAKTDKGDNCTTLTSFKKSSIIN